MGATGVADLVAVVVAPGVGVAMVSPAVDGVVTAGPDDWPDAVRRVEASIAPRWVMWSSATAVPMVEAGIRVARSWDVAAVHRLIVGGWRADPARAWAWSQGLAASGIPEREAPDLFNLDQFDDAAVAEPVRADGYLRPDWVDGGWATSADRLVRWAELATEVADRQRTRVGELCAERPRTEATARAESTAELLCAELSVDGLPMDRAAAEEIVAGFVGARPRTEAEAEAAREERDATVLRHAPAGMRFDLRSPGQVKSLLRSVGIEVPDTRAGRLETMRDAHPLVDALLVWRKSERVATTYGYGWLDEHLSGDGRLRGEWSGSDGAAGRMTASGGLHNMPADMRGAVVAEPGNAFVRADLGQIEPRVLAAVSGDRALAHATQADDLYAPVAADLDVDRATAKVAVLGAMYGQTTGHGAEALRGLHAAYPVAMAYLDDAARRAEQGEDLRTFGGRLVRMGSAAVGDLDDREARSAAAARGRYGRNAMVQGAAAELFKIWAVTVRARAAAHDARIVLCLHDELLVHAPAEHAAAVAALVDECLQEAAHRWAPDRSVRFLADTSVIGRWSDAKD